MLPADPVFRCQKTFLAHLDHRFQTFSSKSFGAILCLISIVSVCSPAVSMCLMLYAGHFAAFSPIPASLAKRSVMGCTASV